MKKLNMNSPLGIALTVAGIVLAVSPEARRTVRRMFVKGTAGMLDTMEQVGGITSGMMNSNTTTSLPVETIETSVVSPELHASSVQNHSEPDYH